MSENGGLNWQESVSSTFENFAGQFVEQAPQVIAGIALLAAGWLVAYLLAAATKRVVGGIDLLFKRGSKSGNAKQARMQRTSILIISKAVFWTVMLFFIAATANMLGWKMFSGWMDGVITYLPNLIAGIAIVLGGILLSNSARTIISTAAASAGVEHFDLLSRLVQIAILFTAIVIGVEQIGINVQFLTSITLVIVGILLAGAALAFGLGAKTLIANVIGSQQLRQQCRLGETMTVGQFEGIVTEVTRTTVCLETEAGRTVVPAKLFLEQASSFMAASANRQEARHDS
ncbi:mechanosensitive ion channel domain-containing protein [Mariprofundus sp. KV]|uniref:mechanosensitive ion channel family protein n=1 Tax=Mariprofundus sp. KV TaxID=2608715 RepID=UPI0015A3202B|nr:mechanosensitive ion channel domain-containing protein [Mariprofundus sp. KV]NWF35929.1 mechanosensitive ion channel [Mariprofundus sp. KV]